MTWLEKTIIDELFLGVLAIFALVCGVWAAGHALLHKRDPRSALVWVTISLTLPIIGALSYWILGINRITRRAMHLKKRGWRLNIQEMLAQHRQSSASLPTGCEQLRDLAELGDRVVHNRLQPGNRISPLENGEQAYPAMLAAIQGSVSTVHLCCYIFDGDGAGAAFVEALSAAARRGVQVRVIVDAMGERYSRLTARAALADSGVDIRLYLPLSKGPFINLRNHRKLLVVDGVRAFTGGMNIRTNHCVSMVGQAEATHDLHFEVQGPVIGDLQKAFLEDWYFVSGQVLDNAALFPEIPHCGTAVVRAVSDGPDREFRKLEWIVMGALSVARKRVRIMTPYFIPDRSMVTAITTAALRGVEIILVLPAHNNLPFVAWASRASYWELLKNGVRIIEQGPAFVHSKLLVVDDCWSLIGSANLDTRSLRLNFELNLSIYDQQFAALIDRYFDQAQSTAHEVTLDEMDGRSLPVRLRDGAARLFSPYL